MNNLTNIISQLREVIFMSKNYSKSLPLYGKPNSTELHYDGAGKPDQLRLYGSTGFVSCDYDFDDHNKPKYHSFPKHNGAHKHYYRRNEDGSIEHSRQTELTDCEYETFIKPYINIK